MLAEFILAKPLENGVFVRTKGDNPKLDVARIFFSSVTGRRHLGRVVAEVASISRQEIVEMQQILQRFHEGLKEYLGKVFYGDVC